MDNCKRSYLAIPSFVNDHTSCRVLALGAVMSKTIRAEADGIPGPCVCVALGRGGSLILKGAENNRLDVDPMRVVVDEAKTLGACRREYQQCQHQHEQHSTSIITSSSMMHDMLTLLMLLMMLTLMHSSVLAS